MNQNESITVTFPTVLCWEYFHSRIAIFVEDPDAVADNVETGSITEADVEQVVMQLVNPMGFTTRTITASRRFWDLAEAIIEECYDAELSNAQHSAGAVRKSHRRASFVYEEINYAITEAKA